MLNIETRISLSHKSKYKIAKYKIANEKDLSNSWSRIDKSIKNEISKKLMWNQQYKCAYCGQYLVGLSPEIDHFVTKTAFSNFTFTTVNLFYACRNCNSPNRKGQKLTIIGNPTNYNECVFNIVHPYFNNPNNEIIYKDNDCIDFDWDLCSAIGKNTITFFKFDDYEMTYIRSKVLLNERANPIDDYVLKKLILEAISYK